MIVMLIVKVSPGKFFVVCPTASHVYFLHKRLNYGEKKFFVSLVYKKRNQKKKNKKKQEKLMKFLIIETSNYVNFFI